MLLLGMGCPRWQPGDGPPRPNAGRYLKIDGHWVRYVDRGAPSRPAVLFVHGFASSWIVWKPLMAALGDRYRVLALDLPGFGLSSKRPGDYSPEGLGDLLDRFLAARGVDRAHVVAHSWGSAVALALAVRHPRRVRSLTLMGAFVYEAQVVPFMRWARVRGLGEALFALFYKERAGDRMALAFYDPERHVTYAVEQAVERALDRPGAVRAALEATRQMRLAGLERAYRRVAVPTLLLWGREDRVALLRFGERLAREMPRARLRVFARCGHFPMIEAFGGTRAALRAHLADVAARADRLGASARDPAGAARDRAAGQGGAP